MENIDKMINCGDPSFGGAMYGCPKCGNFKFVPFRCHSRFCPSCGAKYSIERAQAMSFKLINCKHRHVVFTIAKELRHYFLEDRDLLNLMEERVTDPVKKAKFKKDKALSYKNQKDGFYIYAKPNLADSKTVAKYIGRYLGRPVIALSRIDGYDKDEDTVTFHYNRHEDDVLVTETRASIDFIKPLIQHIPEKGFKMIRYYGVYARNNCRQCRLQIKDSVYEDSIVRTCQKYEGQVCIRV